jgi:DNA polymerase III gamma/tau subunit
MKLTHHANLIVGPAEKAISMLAGEFDAESELSIERFDTLGIDEARELSRRQRLSGGHIFIIAAGTITREAQNALLKTFEEPAPDTYFMLIIPRAR